MEWGLFVETVASTLWRPGDGFRLSAVRTQACRTVEIPAESHGTHDAWGFPRLISRWQTDPEALIHDGQYLPVSLAKL